MQGFLSRVRQMSLVKKIGIGLILGVLLAIVAPTYAAPLSLFGKLFVSALKAVAPILVFFLVMSAISQHKKGQKTNMKSIIVLYVLGTFFAAVTAVVVSFIFPITLNLSGSVGEIAPPSGIQEVLENLLLNIVDNPVNALVNANYIGILSWALMIGVALRPVADTTKLVIHNIAEAISQVVRWIINFAPLGIMGLVFDAIASSGLSTLVNYVQLVMILIGCMMFVALVINPLLVFIKIKQNPYPLVFKCLKESGITAFFTRSSAANIPVNIELCENLNLDKDTYSVSIPLGATINMGGAAITITVLSLAAAHTLNIPVDFVSAIILSIIATVSACGASGVAGGSLLLIPLACSLFGIPNEYAMMVVGTGFIVGVIQDSAETGLNSSTDVLFTAASEFATWKKQGKAIVIPK